MNGYSTERYGDRGCFANLFRGAKCAQKKSSNVDFERKQVEIAMARVVHIV